jgi:hypothetical protein
MPKSWDMAVGIFSIVAGLVSLIRMPKTKARLTELEQAGRRTPQEARKALMASRLLVLCLFAIGSGLICKAWFGFYY